MSVSSTAEHPLVSVIITNYNYGRYLPEAIEGVLNQTYRNYELIIVDDGSTDDSRRIIEDYVKKEPGRIVSVLKENGGQASAFNAGYEHSRGEMISFLDSDDYWTPERLAKVVEVFKTGMYSIVQHNMEFTDEHSRPSGRLYRRGLFTGDAKRLLLDYCHFDFFVPTSGICFQRSVLEKIFPVPESWQICADAYLTRIVLFYGFLYSFEKSLGYYRIHGKNNWMFTPRQKQTDIALDIIDAINSHLAKNGFRERVDIIKNPLYRGKYVEQRPGLLEPFLILKMLPGFPFVSFLAKLAITRRMLNVVLRRLLKLYGKLIIRLINPILDSHTFAGNGPRPSLKLQIWRNVRYRAAGVGIPLTENERRLCQLKDCHRNQRAFIIGNGPSLNRCDLKLLKDEITFGVNSIFLNYESMGYYPTYYIVEDVLVAEDRASEINSYNFPMKLFGNYLRYCFHDSNDTLWLNVRFRYDDYEGFPHFSGNAARMVWVGGTVSYICLQLAYYMGFREVYLVGFDHSYSIPHTAIVAGNTITSTSDDPNHFHPSYFGKGYRWHDPRVYIMEKSYVRAKQVFESDGRTIFNATAGGKLEVFNRVDYQSLF
jgi:glycosyltransferase involved in cell wall biosynthesis